MFVRQTYMWLYVSTGKLTGKAAFYFISIFVSLLLKFSVTKELYFEFIILQIVREGARHAR